jgi:aryl-alcohol dehydrogenase-like predicted oxidoreductase
VHLRVVPGSDVPFAESLDAMRAMVAEGKIARLGLSNVTVDQIRFALDKTPIATVQNLYHVGGASVPFIPAGAHAGHDDPDAALALCEQHGIAFMPFFPLAVGAIDKNAAVAAAAAKHGATPSQLAIAWLLARSPQMLPIPGTSKVAHLEENCAAANISLDVAEVAAIRAAAAA